MMTSFNCTARAWARLLLGLIVVSPVSRAMEHGLTGLLINSPFASDLGKVAAESTQVLEFRGYIGVGSTTLFSIARVDSNGQTRSVWLGLQEPHEEYVVRAFDQVAETVQVEYQGQNHTLKIKLSRVQQLPSMQASVIDPIGDTRGKERLEALAGEIRRRRASGE